MRIPARFAPLVFGALLSVTLVAPWVRGVVGRLTA
jgi:hypothetical protein